MEHVYTLQSIPSRKSSYKYPNRIFSVIDSSGLQGNNNQYQTPLLYDSSYSQTNVSEEQIAGDGYIYQKRMYFAIATTLCALLGVVSALYTVFTIMRPHFKHLPLLFVGIAIFSMWQVGNAIISMVIAVGDSFVYYKFKTYLWVASILNVILGCTISLLAYTVSPKHTVEHLVYHVVGALEILNTMCILGATFCAYATFTKLSYPLLHKPFNLYR